MNVIHGQESIHILARVGEQGLQLLWFRFNIQGLDSPRLARVELKSPPRRVGVPARMPSSCLPDPRRRDISGDGAVTATDGTVPRLGQCPSCAIYEKKHGDSVLHVGELMEVLASRLVAFACSSRLMLSDGSPSSSGPRHPYWRDGNRRARTRSGDFIPFPRTGSLTQSSPTSLFLDFHPTGNDYPITPPYYIFTSEFSHYNSEVYFRNLRLRQSL